MACLNYCIFFSSYNTALTPLLRSLPSLPCIPPKVTPSAPGTEQVELEILQTTSEVVLHALDLVVSSVQVSSPSTGHMTPTTLTTDPDKGRITYRTQPPSVSPP